MSFVPSSCLCAFVVKFLAKAVLAQTWAFDEKKTATLCQA
jgi:hypothetical protein